MLRATDEPSSGGQSRDTGQRKLDYFGYSILLVGLPILIVALVTMLLKIWRNYLTDSRGELLPVFFETSFLLAAMLICGFCFRLLLVSPLDEALRLPEAGCGWAIDCWKRSRND